jgi:hypothetical protein
VVVVTSASGRDFGPISDGTSRPHGTLRSQVVAASARFEDLLATGMAAATGDVIAVLDDTTAPRRAWLQELLLGFLDPTVGAVGGPVADSTARAAPLGPGEVTWWGGVTRREAMDPARYGDAHVLVPGNLAFRRELASLGVAHDRAGRAPGWEVGLCLEILRSGHRVLYSPWALVDRLEGPAPDDRDETSIFAAAANCTHALLRYLPPVRRGAFLARVLLVGSRSAPGLLRAASALVGARSGRVAARQVTCAWRGRLTGIAGYRAWRRRALRR